MMDKGMLQSSWFSAMRLARSRKMSLKQLNRPPARRKRLDGDWRVRIAAPECRRTSG